MPFACLWNISPSFLSFFHVAVAWFHVCVCVCVRARGAPKGESEGGPWVGWLKCGSVEVEGDVLKCCVCLRI